MRVVVAIGIVNHELAENWALIPPRNHASPSLNAAIQCWRVDVADVGCSHLISIEGTLPS
ncbi:MAG: hypothetical protein B7Z55_13515 [Planctomycetales bacterium 12-60-4]|nr:MAG: hypothetical protein B7Z55_13515 [Planctomycetales bacterium 12-60-4]